MLAWISIYEGFLCARYPICSRIEYIFRFSSATMSRGARVYPRREVRQQGRLAGQESKGVYKDLLKAITGTEKAHKPKDLAEWTLVPRVNLVWNIVGDLPA